MDILIVEDNVKKLERIVNYLKPYHHQYTVAKSYNSAKTSIIANSYDLLILDMTLPENDDETELIILAGTDLLDLMKFMKIFTPTVLLTGYDRFGRHEEMIELTELERKLYKQFPKILKDVIFYNSTSEDWKNRLSTLLG